MANYDKETKFYWLSLKEDFFEEDSISWLEEQKPKGKEYSLFYIKLCLKSLKSNGILIRKVGEILVPYDNQKLAELTNTDFDTVGVAMALLQKIGLVKKLESGAIYLTQIENLIGSKSKGAFKKQQQRQSLSESGQMSTLMSTSCLPECPPFETEISNLSGGETNVHPMSTQCPENCPPKLELELELELDKEKEINKEKQDVKNKYFESENLNSAFLDWLEYKKQRKDKYTEIGLTKLISQINNHLKNHSEDEIINLINNCIASSYQGIVFEKLPNVPKKELDSKNNEIPDWVYKMGGKNETE